MKLDIHTLVKLLKEKSQDRLSMEQFIQFSFSEITMEQSKNGEWKKKYILPKGWNELTESRIIAGQHNRGILTGKKNNLTVIDFDDIMIWDSFMKDCEQLGINLNDYYAVQTKKGFHCYFEYDPDFKTTTNLVCKYGLKDSKIDCRNDGGFITAPPTQYRDEIGKMIVYEPLGGQILPMPEGIKKLLSPLPKVVKKCQVVVSNNREILTQLLPILQPLSNNYIDWIKVGIAMKHTDLTFLDLFHLFSAMCPEKYDETKCNDVWEEIKDGNLKIGSIFYWCKKINPTLTEQILSSYELEDDNDEKYQELKDKYETEYSLAFINKTTTYSYLIGTNICFYNKSDLSQVLFPIKIGKKRFLDLWNDDPFRKSYNEVGVYPHDTMCPPNVLNLWTGFAVEKIQGEIVSIDSVLEHLRILCGRDQKSEEFMLKWLANFFQYPSQTSVMPFLQGSEGCGKGMFMKLLTLMIGNDKVFVCHNMENDLMDKFTGHLQNAMLVNIDEIEYKMTAKFKEQIKSMLTRDVISINEKGMKRFTIPHYIKYIVTANPETPFQISEKDRRIAPIQSTEELIGNADYFTEFNRIIYDKNVQYSFYKYLMDYQTVIQLGSNDIPETNLRIQAKIMSRDSIEDFLEQFIGQVDSNGLFSEYKQFMTRSNIPCNISIKGFQMKAKKFYEKYRISEKNVDKLIKGKRIRGCYYYVGEFDESLLEKNEEVGEQSP